MDTGKPNHQALSSRGTQSCRLSGLSGFLRMRATPVEKTIKRCQVLLVLQELNLRASFLLIRVYSWLSHLFVIHLRRSTPMVCAETRQTRQIARFHRCFSVFSDVGFPFPTRHQPGFRCRVLGRQCRVDVGFHPSHPTTDDRRCKTLWTVPSNVRRTVKASCQGTPLALEKGC